MKGTFSVAEPFKFDRAKARDRLGEFVSLLKAEYGPFVKDETHQWKSADVLEYSIVGVRGGVIHGTVTIGEGVASISGSYDVPRFVTQAWVQNAVRAALRKAVS